MNIEKFLNTVINNSKEYCLKTKEKMNSEEWLPLTILKEENENCSIDDFAMLAKFWGYPHKKIVDYVSMLDSIAN